MKVSVAIFPSLMNKKHQSPSVSANSCAVCFHPVFFYSNAVRMVKGVNAARVVFFCLLLVVVVSEAHWLAAEETDYRNEMRAGCRWM